MWVTHTHAHTDIVFFIFLYQRWIYRVDPKRVNEFGTSGEDSIRVKGAQGGTEREEITDPSVTETEPVEDGETDHVKDEQDKKND